MTIRRKLFISNVLMIAIPVAAYAGIALLFGLVILALYVTNNMPPIPPELKLVLTDYMAGIILIWVILFFALTIIVFITIRVLTKTMLKTIVKPLDVLSNAAREIQNNNLQYRIEYNEVDEFKDVCNTFNNMSQQLCRMITERERAEESRRELIAGLSHDLRTPLTAIKVHVEGLQIGVAATPEQQTKYLATIMGKTDNMEHLIDRLILFSKLDMEDFPMNLHTVELHETLSKMIHKLADEYAHKSLHIAYSKMNDTGFVTIDTMLLQNVIVNILENSVQYRDKEQAELRIEVKYDNDTVEIALSDNGPGVAPEKINLLFDVFYRIEGARNTKGSGLGLAISAKIIKKMNGTIHAQAAKNGGLAIVIRLPAVPKPEKYNGK